MSPRGHVILQSMLLMKALGPLSGNLSSEGTTGWGLACLLCRYRLFTEDSLPSRALCGNVSLEGSGNQMRGLDNEEVLLSVLC